MEECESGKKKEERKSVDIWKYKRKVLETNNVDLRILGRV